MLILIIFYVLGSNILIGQYAEPNKLNIYWDLGVIAESGILILEKKILNNPWSETIQDTATKYGTQIYPISIYLSGRVNLSKRVCLEFRPGLFFGGEEYFGSELGFYLRYQIIINKLYLAAGVNYHYNTDAAHNGFTSSDETFQFYVLNCGINLSEKLAFIISYYYQHKKEFLYQVYGEYTTNYNLKDIIKFGFDLTF